MMISRFLPVPDGDTVLNYYALPLVGTNRRYFGPDFISTKVNRDGSTVFVEVVDFHDYSDADYPNKAALEDKCYLFYKVPNVFFNDIQLILKGKYSRISDEAKRTIRSNSGLQHQSKRGNSIVTSKMLLALDRDPILVKYLYDNLKCGEDPELYKLLQGVELTEKVGEEDFI